MSGAPMVTVQEQASLTMFTTLCKIAGGHVEADDAAQVAHDAVKEAERILRDGEPLHGIATDDRAHGEQMGQPPGVLYTLTVTDTGDVNEWRSDRVQTAEQVAWLHEQVMAAAEHLAGTAGASGAGVN